MTATQINIGNVSTITGPVPGLFSGARLATQAFVAYQNSIGGVCGRQLVLQSADDDLQESQNAAAIQSMQNNVLAFVGSFSLADDGGAPVMASSGVPDIGEAITAARFNLPNNFSPQPNPPGWTTGPFIYLASKYGSAVTSKMAILADDQPTAQQEASNIQAAMESVGYKFIYSETNVQPTQTDFSAEIATMQSMGVQGIVNFGSGGQMGAMAAQMEQAGWSVPLNTWNPSAYDPAFLATAGSGANGSILEQSTALFQGQDASVIPEVALFDKWYHAVAGASAVPNTYAIYGWLSGMLFVQSLNAGGAPTRTALLTGLRTITSFNGNGIEAESNPAGKQAPTCWILIDVKNSQFVRDPVDPTSGFLCSPSGYYSIK